MDNAGRCKICGTRSDSGVCEGCKALPHYEYHKLRLLNKMVDKKPHGYWKEVEQIQVSLETIAEQLTKIVSGNK